MLQFGPFLAHLTSYLEADPRAPEDEYVCLLPLAWIMEQVYVVGMPLLSRIRVNFPESAETSMADMREIGPTHLLLAPRVWEQLAADMRARIMDANPLTRRLFAWGVREGVRALEQGRRSRLAELLLFGTLRDRLGMSRVKSAATGGAALGPDTFKFFLAMGVPLRQLYGQTEASGAYTLQDGSDIDLDSSGLPFGDTEIRILDPDGNGVGEIATRHPGLFAGYFGNEEAARETLTADGWLLTGDAGYLDRRAASSSSTGCATSRPPAGRALLAAVHREQAEVQPLRRRVRRARPRPALARGDDLRALLDGRQVGRAATDRLHHLPEPVGQPAHLRLLAGEVEKVNASLPEGQRVRRFVLLYKELDADDGELTRTRKVRRNIVDQRYQPIIDAVYAGLPRVQLEAEVTFEDGRKGRTSADIEIRDTTAAAATPPAYAAGREGGGVGMATDAVLRPGPVSTPGSIGVAVADGAARTAARPCSPDGPVGPGDGVKPARGPRRREIGEVLLQVEDVSLRFGGVAGDQRRELRRPAARSAPSSARTGRQVVDAERDQRLLSPPGGPASPGRARPGAGCGRTRPRPPASPARSKTSRCSRHEHARQHHDRPVPEDARELPGAGPLHRPRPSEEVEHRAFVERIIDFLEIQHVRHTPVGKLPYGLQKRVELARRWRPSRSSCCSTSRWPA
jgi:hypothetical protein